jgi:hypothetical protein
LEPAKRKTQAWHQNEYAATFSGFPAKLERRRFEAQFLTVQCNDRALYQRMANPISKYI